MNKFGEHMINAAVLFREPLAYPPDFSYDPNYQNC